MTKGSTSGSVRWIHEVRVDDAVTFRRGKLGSRMVADWPGFARLTCARDGSAATLVPAAGVSRRAIEDLRGGPVNALLRDLAGQLALHASAVAIEGKAVMFLGENGAGKSTAAAEMCLGHRAQMLADDVALLEIGEAGVDVLPSDGRHWLTRESCLALGIPQPRAGASGDKRELRSSNIAGGPCPLALVVALCFGPSLATATLRPLRGSDAARLLLAAAIRFDVEDARARRREFEQVTTVYRRAPFLELVRPAKAPGEVGSFVLDALGKGL
jgi:hypothetical protein